MRLKAITGIVLTVLLVGMLTLAFVCARASNSWNNTGIQTLTTTETWWGRLVVDAKWSWDAQIQLKNDFYPSYGNLIGRYHSTDGATDPIREYILISGLAMYKLTGNTTYLDYARDTCDDIIEYMQDDTTKLIGHFSNSTGEIIYDATSITEQVLRFVAELAMLNSSYVDTYKELADTVIEYNLEANEAGYALPVGCYPNGTKVSNPEVSWHGLGERTCEGLLLGYILTGNTTYLHWVRDIIVEWWSTRDNDEDPTQLVPMTLYSETKNWRYTYTKQYSIGSFLRMSCLYYFCDENSTIYNIINNCSKSICNYFYDGDNWDNKIYVDSGSVCSGIIEANWATLDYGMIMAYDIIGNSTFLEYALENFNSCFQDEGYNLYNNLIAHATNDTGGLINAESSMVFGFQSISPVWAWWQSNGNTTTEGNNRMFLLYNQTIRRHPLNAEYQQGTYGYRTYIEITDYSNLTGRPYRHNQAPLTILPWLHFHIRPSTNVNVTWVTLPNKKLYQMWDSRCYSPNHWFTNVTFNYEQKKITFDEITGSGTVTFNNTIISAKRDGVSYSNFSGSTLTTVSGPHSYEVCFARAHVAPPVGGIWIPVDKLALLAPHIGLVSTIILATIATAVFVKLKKKKQQIHSFPFFGILGYLENFKWNTP